MKQRDAADACREITPRFWSALRSDEDAGLAQSGQPPLPKDCVAGLQSLFKLAGNQQINGAGLSVTDVVVREHPPALGAIVVFHPPAGADSPTPKCGASDEGLDFSRPCGKPTPGESTETFVKRIVGLPGDRIAIVNGTVIRNGRPEARAYKVEPCTGSSLCSFPHPITVPPNEYFLLGDNLSASDDSRFWGPVKRAWFIGLVTPP